MHLFQVTCQSLDMATKTNGFISAEAPCRFLLNHFEHEGGIKILKFDRSICRLYVFEKSIQNMQEYLTPFFNKRIVICIKDINTDEAWSSQLGFDYLFTIKDSYCIT